MKFINKLQEFFRGKKKGFSLQKTVKTAIVITGLSVGVMSVFSACSSNDADKNVTPEVSTPPAVSDVVLEDEPEVVIDEDFILFADIIEIENLRMTDNTSQKTAEAAKAANQAMHPGVTIYDPSDVYQAPDGTAWESEQDYVDYTEGDTTVDIGNGYLAPDGSVWTSKEEYDKYINGLNNQEETITEGNFYTAPDGTVWNNKAEYDAWVKSNNGTSVTTVTGGDVIESGTGYKAPDGSYWSSEQDYLDYIKGTSSNNNNSSATQDGVIEGDFYKAPDGSVWGSKAEYDAYIKGTASTYSATATAATETVVEEEANDFYKAEDGSYWETYQDYLDYQAAQTNEIATTTFAAVLEETPVVEEASVIEETIQEVEENNFYTDPDGFVWASYDDYALYMQSLQNEANQK